MASTLRAVAPTSLSVVRMAQKPASSGRLSTVVVSAQTSVKTSIRQTAAVAIKKAVGEEGSKNLQRLSFVALNAFLALPSLAEEEKGVIFDFNLTLPIIAIQFLLLMFALDKIWFKPVGEYMDARDEDIRKQLLNARGDTGEAKALRQEAESLLKAARAETVLAVEKAKKEAAADLDNQLLAVRATLEKDLQAALATLESEKEATLGNLNAQVKALSDDIVKKVLPAKA